MDPWAVLGIEQTDERKSVKRAYAKKLKAIHPEDDPEGFKQLRAAYEAVLYQLDHPHDHPAVDTDSSGTPLISVNFDSGERSGDTSEPQANDRDTAEYAEAELDSETQAESDADPEPLQNEMSEAEALFDQFWDGIRGKTVEEAVTDLSELLGSDALVNIELADQFEAILFQSISELEDPQLQYSFLHYLMAMPEYASRKSTDWRLLQLQEIVEHRRAQLEEQYRDEARKQRAEMLALAQEWAAELQCVVEEQGDAAALACLQRQLGSEEYQDERFRGVYRHELVMHVESLGKGYWPQQLMAALAEECCLQGKDRIDSEYKNIIDYIGRRQISHGLIQSLQQRARESNDGFEKEAIECLLNTDDNSTNHAGSSAAQKRAMRKMLRFVEKNNVDAWEADLGGVERRDYFYRVYHYGEMHREYRNYSFFSEWLKWIKICAVIFLAIVLILAAATDMEKDAGKLAGSAMFLAALALFWPSVIVGARLLYFRYLNSWFDHLYKKRLSSPFGWVLPQTLFITLVLAGIYKVPNPDISFVGLLVAFFVGMSLYQSTDRGMWMMSSVIATVFTRHHAREILDLDVVTILLVNALLVNLLIAGYRNVLVFSGRSVELDIRAWAVAGILAVFTVRFLVSAMGA